MNSCLPKKITGSIQKKNGYLYLSLNTYIDGKRKPKMINTGLDEKGYHTRKASALLKTALSMLNSGKTIEEVMEEVQGDQFRKKPDEPSEQVLKGPLPFLRPELVQELEIQTPVRKGDIDNSVVQLPYLPDDGNPSRIRFGSKRRTGDDIQVSEYFKRWVKIPRKSLDAGTLNNYVRHCELRIIPYFEYFDVKLSELEEYDVTMFYEYCLRAGRLDGFDAEVSSTTICRVHSVFHKALNEAVSHGIIKSNPATKAEKPKAKDFIPNVYTAEQVNCFLEAALGDPIALACVALFEFSLRRGEALGIKETVVDHIGQQLEIRHQVTLLNGRVIAKDILKTSTSHRVLPMSKSVAEIFRLQIEKNRQLRQAYGPSWNPKGYLFVYADGRVIHPSFFTKHFNKIAHLAGLPIIRLHDSRHTSLTLGMKNGVPTRILQAYAGHADIKITEKYTHWNSGDLIQVTDSLDKVIQIPKEHFSHNSHY